MQSRIVSLDSYVSIDASKYSVPVQWVGKSVQFRIIYGFRIMIYDRKEQLILSVERADEKGTVIMNPEHYKDIAPRVSTSIPQIRRDFTQLFTNGKRYLETAGRKFEQPTHHARKIMELTDLYNSDVLDYFIGKAIDEECMDIRSFRSMLKKESRKALRELQRGKDRNTENHTTERIPNDADTLIRDLDYYEAVAGGEMPHGK